MQSDDGDDGDDAVREMNVETHHLLQPLDCDREPQQVNCSFVKDQIC